MAIRAFRHDLATFRFKGGRGVIPGLPSIGGVGVRWVVNSSQSDYMKKRQRQNQSRLVQAEVWANEQLEKTGKKWSRQSLWGCRIFDFWCAELGIAVEIDGIEHDANYDAARDLYNYYRSGIIVCRVRNYNQLDMDAALQTIKTADSWKGRKQKMRQEFGLSPADSFRKILKLTGIPKAHGNWEPKLSPD